MEQNANTLADYIDLVKRRKYYILITWTLLSAISVVVAYNLPKTYRSTATMLIQAPIPTTVIESTISQFADVQIQTIYQRVMTNDNVLAIIESNNLYDDIKNGDTKYPLAVLFKKNTEIKLTSSSLAPLSHSGIAEIAFDISFSHSDSTKAQEVANKLASLFIRQSDIFRARRALKTTNFLTEESDELNRELQEIDRRIVKFKEANSFALPEQIKNNQAAIERIEGERIDTDRQIRVTKERIAFLAAELARTQIDLPTILDTNAPQNKEDTIKSLRAKYLRYSSIYFPSHPNLARLKREIRALDPNFEGELAEEEIRKRLVEVKRELKLLEETYAGTHPDIAKRRNQISKLEKQLKINGTSPQSQPDQVRNNITNPTYLALNTQYKSSQSELSSLIENRDYLKEKLNKIQTSFLVAPQIEMQYSDLLRERDNTVNKYNQLKEKLLDAKLIQALEEQQEGQTLTLIEQPIRPIRPEGSNRRKVAIGGFFMGIIAGLGIAFLVEFLDPGIRGYRAVTEVTGLMPLVVIPSIETPSEVEDRLVKQARMRKVVVMISMVCVLLAAIAIWVFFLPSLKT